MKVFFGPIKNRPISPCVLTIGNFDGVHQGHKKLLARVCKAAAELKLNSTVMTFEPPPREFFAQITSNFTKIMPSRIASMRDKLQSLSETGIDRVVIQNFGSKFANMSPRDFIEEILLKYLHVKFLIVGKDFCFGHHRLGNVETLIEASKKYDFQVEILPTIVDNGIKISSSAIRAALSTGDLANARLLLGHSYAVSGHVIHGKKLGRTIGFPTLNLRIKHRSSILSGVFVANIHGLSEKPLPAVANIGIRPTVEDSGGILLESHVLDFTGECYGKVIKVEFLQKLREEKKYTSLSNLTAAIEHDVASTRAYFR